MDDYWLIPAILLWAGVAAFLGSYLKRKGENLATQDDIEKITKKVESVRATFNEKLEAIREKKELKVAALDKRLATHQAAFTLWRELLSSVYTKKCSDVVLNAKTGGIRIVYT